MTQEYEFDISETDFLDMRKDAIPVETLPELPPLKHHDRPATRINYAREIPVYVPRYNYAKPEHSGCDPFNRFEKCRHDPDDERGESCSHGVSAGYYYERRAANGGGVRMLYDRENGRCYIYANHH